MDILSKFTMLDVFFVALGLVIASLIRIFYDSYQERKRLKKLGQMVKIYNESMDTYEEGIVMISDNDEVIFSNKEASRIFGCSTEKVTMKDLLENVNIRVDGQDTPQKLFKAFEKSKKIPHAYITVDKQTMQVSISLNHFHLDMQNGEAWKIIIVQDISHKMELEEKIDNMGSYKDLLTNLPTRYHLNLDLVSVIMKTTQNDLQVAVGMFSIKEFYSLQVTHGLEKIDILLKNLAKKTSKILQKNEILYRFNCEAFAIIFEDIVDKNEARMRIERIVLQVQQILENENLRATILQSLYFIDPQNHTPEKILNDAYRILRSKNNEKIFIADTPSLADKININDTHHIAKQLTKKDFLDAIKHKDFFFFYQPLFSLHDNTIIGVEVLTRLNHKKYGFLLAKDFMRKAIEHEVMPEITTHLLDTVLGQKKFWAIERGFDLDMTINLSLADLQSGVFAEMLESKLLEYSIDPETIIIDIEESIILEDFDSVMEEFYMLNKIGVRLTVDHFGKESINLKYTERLPLYAIKIDGTLIDAMSDSLHKKRVVSSIIAIAKEFGLHVGANHVDSEEVKIELEVMGCDFVQGHHLGKAVPAFEITEILGGQGI